MKEMMMSQMGFWTAFTILFMIIVMAWFIKKMIKLSKQKPAPLEYEDDA